MPIPAHNATAMLQVSEHGDMVVNTRHDDVLGMLGKTTTLGSTMRQMGATRASLSALGGLTEEDVTAMTVDCTTLKLDAQAKQPDLAATGTTVRCHILIMST
jgi:hypothetical protein